MTRKILSGIVCAVACGTVAASVYDDAKLWWKFDNGGADGAVVQASEIHDARDANAAVPAAVYGAQGGPLWSRTKVRLPTQHRTVESTALYLPCETRYTTTNQFFQASMLFNDIQVDSKDITVVARVKFDGNDVVAADCVLLNNGYHWSQYISQAFGFIKESSVRGPNAIYYPYTFAARTYIGGYPYKKLAMKVGQWYDVAYSLHLGDDGTNYMTYAVSGDMGFATQMLAYQNNYASGAAKTYTRIASMGAGNTGWGNYSPTISKNSGDAYKNFSGWLHQLAVWDRALTLDEIKEAFGSPDDDGGDPYSNAVHWWRFDRDLNGDGIVQTNEFRAVRNWGGTDPGAFAPEVAQPSTQGGPFGGPLWTNVNVYLPGRGVTVESPCMYFPVLTNSTQNSSNETVYTAFSTYADLPRAARPGSATIVARICPFLHYGALVGANAYFYDNGLNWGDWSGWEVGLARLGSDTSGTNFVPTICIAHSTYYFNNLKLKSYDWYDIAFIINDAGLDADGNELTDSITAVLCSKEHGFNYQTISAGTTVYSSYGTYGVGRFGGEVAYGKYADYYNASNRVMINNGNATKCFHGLIHQIALWDRALTVDEVGAVFGYPNNMVMGVGTGDGDSGEFAVPGEGTYDYTLGEAWHEMAASIDAGNPTLTIRFTPEANNLELVHVLHLKTAEVGSSGQTALLKVKLNGRTLESSQEVASCDDAWIMVPKSALVSGENTLTISYLGGTASSVAIDKIEIGGSWQVGNDNGNNYEFSQEGSGRGVNYYVGNRYLKNMIRSTTSGTRNSYLHFYLPAEVATNHTFTYTSRYNDESGASGATNSFCILVNGVEKYRSPDGGLSMGDYMTFEVGKGELQPGWNTINNQFLYSKGWMTFDFFSLVISDYMPGTILLIR